MSTLEAFNAEMPPHEKHPETSELASRNRSQTTSNKLFLVCPFSRLEPFIRENYGDNVYFLTALGTHFQADDAGYVKKVVDFILREGIRELYVVNDTSCRFINKTLKREPGFGTKAEYLLKQIYLENYLKVRQNNDLREQQVKLAALNVYRQMHVLLHHKVLSRLCLKHNITIHGVVTSKETKQIVII
ncbi:hypothetical protein [Haliscomenobacter hydrossis]|uniref:Carbonic anhydrase n=1 Tax=Haliscomenobacter hydrossis (strain ATCC 27775 / DSM 1100 / LMG 10767 / O) TaxID=760192 RepID=F4KSI0_HALH1|nr:hypothetical protein [Haliscomenobacter hydrossis]AEE54331.1 hypothetical protein Halhy_6515 [Haliscomenobacter hydrossis DSM 1100]